MDTKEKAWQYLIDVVFNNQKEVPIECVSEFRKLAELHNLDYYCDYLRNKPLPEKLKEDPWEWKYLEDSSKVLPDNVQIVVLKGAAARDMDLYEIPSLRESVDLDIYIPKIEDFKKQKEFIECLSNLNKIKPTLTWNEDLKKFKTFVALAEGHDVDVHFDIFYHGEYKTSLLTNPSTYYEKLLKGVVERVVSYRNLKNVKKLCTEDFWFYSVFHFLKHFPFVNLASILDSFLILKENKTTLEKLKQHAINTDQLYIYNLGVYLLSQLSSGIKESPKVNIIEKKIFKIERIIDPAGYGIVNQFLTRFSKEAIATNGNLILSSISGLLHLTINKLILTSFDNETFTFRGFSNSINKLLYLFTKIKNSLKRVCFKLAVTNTQNLPATKIIPSKKQFLSLQIENMQLTFNIPEEFSEDLKKIWKGYVVNNHLNEYINIERVISNYQAEVDLQITYSKNNLYLKLPNSSYGKSDLKSGGNFIATSFWDVRTFALFLFRAMTFERDDMLLVHAGAVKFSNETLIFPGESSTGKSTFFSILIESGASGINDDTVLLKKEEDIWYACPTPFMSKYTEPIICEKSKLTGILELIKVCGGHGINQIETDYSLALLMHNSIGGFIIDDNGFLSSKIAEKVLDISRQIKLRAQIKYAIDDQDVLLKLINNWLIEPNKTLKHGADLKRVIEFRGISMEPTFKNGDVLLTEEIYPEDLKIKDIIGFRNGSSEMPTIHRIKYLIKHKEQVTVITKGDNCIYDDSPNMFKANKKLLKIVKKFDISKNISLTQQH